MKRFVAIGHVDTGKSCLCGHLLYKCNYVDERTMDKIRTKAKADGMEKWVWSRVLDIYEEEMLKGKTHEFNKIIFDYNDQQYELIDTPGHSTFVRSMIEGISEDVNIAVLLLSMADNEFTSSFERGMLKEHLILARAVGIEHLVIIANKMDLINWDEKDYMKKVKKVVKYLTKYLRWDKKNIKVVPMSAFNGTCLIDTKDMPKWYKGGSFIDVLNKVPNNSREKLESEFIESNVFKGKIVAINTMGSIISAGFSCAMHYKGKEIDIKIEKIKRKPFLRSGDMGECVISLDHKEELQEGGRIILRQGDNTVGFGKILKLKKP